MALWRLTKNSLLRMERCKKGVMGMFPFGCLPLWRREGVTLIAFLKRMKSARISHVHHDNKI
jgi:predicted nucleotide-binding protein (sugar kinase/HSP70/actin superfamily)